MNKNKIKNDILLKKFKKKEKIMNNVIIFGQYSLSKKIFINIFKNPITTIKRLIINERNIKKLLPKKIKTTMFTGDKILINTRDFNGKVLFMFSILYDGEFELSKFLIKNINKYSCFYDIGANYGFYSLLANKLMENREIHAFDANPVIFNYLKRNIKRKNIILNNNIISNENKKIPFFINKKHSGASSANNETIDENYEEIYINSIKIDDYIKNNKKPDIIKVDIEGGEKNFILGATTLLKKYSPIIIMEVWPKYHKNSNLSLEAVNELLKLSYQPYLINKEGDLEIINNFIDFFQNKQNKIENMVFKK